MQTQRLTCWELGFHPTPLPGLDFPSEMVVNGVLRSLHQLDANQVGRTLLTGVINRHPENVIFFVSLPVILNRLLVANNL